MDGNALSLEDQRAQLGLMVISASLWCLFGLDALFAAGSFTAAGHEAAVPAAAGFWAPWWDLNLSASGLFNGAAFLFAAGLLYVFVRLKRVTEAALPIGALTLPIAGAVILAAMTDQLSWLVIAELTTSMGGSDVLLGERDAYAYEMTRDHLPGEVLWSVAGAPLFEEMAFRGLLLGCLLARGWSPWIAVSVTAAAFAATHEQYFLPGLISVFVAGLLFGWLRILSGGLAAPMIAHALVNSWFVYDSWAALAESGLAAPA